MFQRQPEASAYSQLTGGVPSNPCALHHGQVYGLNSGDAVFRETRDLFYLGARKWLNETLR